MKSAFSFLLLLFMLSVPAAGQGGFRNTFDTFTSLQREQFDVYSRDLRAKWERYALTEALERRMTPVQDTVSQQSLQDYNGKLLRISEIIGMDVPQAPQTTSGRKYPKPVFGKDSICALMFYFYGEAQTVSISSRLGHFHPAGISETAVDDFLQELDKLDYSMLLSEIEKRRTVMGYSDWAILEWVQKLSLAVFPQDRYSESVAFTVFLLNRVGLMTRMARVRGRLTVLFAAEQIVYGRKYVVLDTYPFYLADPSLLVTELFTYGNGLGPGTKPLNLRFHAPSSISDSDYKEVAKRSGALGMTLPLLVNMKSMALFSRYPQMEAREYVLAAPDPVFRESLLKALRPLLAGKNEVETINLLLAFLQKDFSYKIDIEQFGYEKPFFPEENFIYAYNDCEDRSILLSFLLKELLQKRVVLLDYKDHLAVAVSLAGNPGGDYVKIGNERYYVCDPSYVNATLGMTMPQYRNWPAKVWIL